MTLLWLFCHHFTIHYYSSILVWLSLPRGSHGEKALSWAGTSCCFWNTVYLDFFFLLNTNIWILLILRFMNLYVILEKKKISIIWERPWKQEKKNHQLYIVIYLFSKMRWTTTGLWMIWSSSMCQVLSDFHAEMMNVCRSCCVKSLYVFMDGVNRCIILDVLRIYR